jgi:hypothetical protein
MVYFSYAIINYVFLFVLNMTTYRLGIKIEIFNRFA